MCGSSIRRSTASARPCPCRAPRAGSRSTRSITWPTSRACRRPRGCRLSSTTRSWPRWATMSSSSAGTVTCGQASLQRVIKVPPQPFAPAPLVFPPKPKGTPLAWPEKLAVSPDGSRLLVALNLAASAAVVDLTQRRSGALVPARERELSRSARRSAERTHRAHHQRGHRARCRSSTFKSATKTATIQVGAPLSHPAGVVVNSSGTRAYVALSNSDQVAVVNLSTRRVVRTISLASGFGSGTKPVAPALGPSGQPAVRRRVRRRRGGGDPPAWQGNVGPAGVVDRRSRPDRRAARSRAHELRHAVVSLRV